MKRWYVAGLLVAVVAVLAIPVRAEDVVAGEKPKAKERHAMEKAMKEKGDAAMVELKVTGKLSKEGEQEAHYFVTTEAGAKVGLPRMKDSKIDLAALVGKTVEVTGQGFKTPAVGEKPEKIHFKTITAAVEAAAAPVVAAPGAVAK